MFTFWLVLTLSCCSAFAPQHSAAPKATDVINRAIAAMGGDSVLRSVERVRYHMMTQWARVSFDERPFQDMGGYEEHFDVRDYTIPAWRNTRRSAMPNGSWLEFVDVVRDSAAGRFVQNRWMPLNITYVDERRELFLYTPDRLLLLAKASPDLKLAPDTAIDGVAHAVARGTIDAFPVSLFFRESDGLPAMLRFRAAHENDFGLTSWGPMDIEVWYSRWTTLPNRISMPTQWDVRRVGRTYKRLSVLSAVFNPTMERDSFAIPDSTRTAYHARERRPMHDVPYDATRIVDTHFAQFTPQTGLGGAVRLGGAWLLLESGQAPINAERAVEWIAKQQSGSVAGTLVANTSGGNGGIAWLTRNQVPVYIAPLAQPVAQLVLRNRDLPDRGYTVIESGRWLKVGSDSLRIEPIDLPNARGTIAAYSPTLKWLWSPLAGTPVDVAVLMQFARARGWEVQRLGTGRAVSAPVS